MLCAIVGALGMFSIAAEARQPAPEPPAAASQTPSPASPDAWHFEDDEAEPGFRAVVRQQAGDLILLVMFLALALVGFFRKSERLKTVTLIASVAYFGIYRSQLLSIVNVFGMLSWNLPILKFNLEWYLFAGFSLATTVLWGRLYCGRVCAFGAMTQLTDRLVPPRWRIEVPARLERRAGYIKYALLGATIIYFLARRDMSIYRYVEPFWLFSGRATVGLWCGLVVLLVATVFVRNLYCRFLCPVGAFLGVLSNLTVFRIKRWSECKSCRICEKTCEWGAIQGPRIIASECVRCDDCERLYMDQQKCPHWIVIRRRSDFTAAQS
jgi:polyferredoxin